MLPHLPNPSDSDAGVLRTQGIAALKAGDILQARTLLVAAASRDANDVQTWIWLSGAVTTPAERRYCLERVLTIDPTHAVAQRGLLHLPDVAAVSPLPESTAEPIVDAAEAAEDEAALPADSPETAAPVANPDRGLARWSSVGIVSAIIGSTLICGALLVLGFTATRLTAFGGLGSRQANDGVDSSVAVVSTETPAAQFIQQKRPTQASPGATAQPQTTTIAPTAPTTPTAEIAPVVPTATAPPDTSTLSVEALTQRGLERERSRDWEGGLEDYDAALSRDPDYAAALFWRAALRTKLGDAAGGQADFDRAAELDPDPATVAYHRGRLLMARDENEAGLVSLTEAIALDPQHDQAYYTRGVYYSEQGNREAAYDDYTRAIEINPNLAKAYYNRGIVEMFRGRYQAAMDDYTTAIERDPAFFAAYFNRALIYNRVFHEYKRALKDYTTALQIRPGDADTLCVRSGLLLKLEETERAWADARHAVESDPAMACGYYARGMAGHERGQNQEALADLNTFIAQEPWHDIGYIGRGTVYNTLGDYEAALDDFAYALQLNPNSPFAYDNRGQTYVNMGEYDMAIAEWEVAADLYQRQGYQTYHDELQEAIAELRVLQQQ